MSRTRIKPRNPYVLLAINRKGGKHVDKKREAKACHDTSEFKTYFTTGGKQR